jgi:hypothetical protein
MNNHRPVRRRLGDSDSRPRASDGSRANGAANDESPQYGNPERTRNHSRNQRRRGR